MHSEIVHASYGTSLDVIDRNIAFCSYVLNSGSSLLVNDTHNDERFVDNPMVVGVGYEYYDTSARFFCQRMHLTLILETY